MISLLYSGNEKVFDGLLISALSVARTTREPLDIHILTMDLTDRDPRFSPISEKMCAILREFACRHNPASRVTLHDMREEFLAELGSSPNLGTSYTPYTLLRLLCDKIELPDRLLYLDTDTAAVKSVLTLYEYPLDGCEFAGARDYLGRVFIDFDYINAGVLVLDMKTIRETAFFERARALVATKKMTFPDQDAINKIATKKCFLPDKYNEQKKMRPETVVRHFSKTIRWLPFFHTVNIKPWDVDGLHNIYRTFDLDPVLDEYRSAIEAFDSAHDNVSKG